MQNEDAQHGKLAEDGQEPGEDDRGAAGGDERLQHRPGDAHLQDEGGGDRRRNGEDQEGQRGQVRGAGRPVQREAEGAEAAGEGAEGTGGGTRVGFIVCLFVCLLFHELSQLDGMRNDMIAKLSDEDREKYWAAVGENEVIEANIEKMQGELNEHKKKIEHYQEIVAQSKVRTWVNVTQEMWSSFC